ncbi:MAG: peptidase S41 [Bacteroidetes bacterium]|nr:MAG: peptidase S41 [Bacteroidota bacterium]
MYDEQLFDVLAEMITELRDGHTNLVSPFNVSRYTFDFPSPENFNFRLLKDNYIGWDYNITGPLINEFIQREDKLIGYIYYGSFSSRVSTWHIDYVLGRFRDTNGIILDMRSNGGGSVTNIYTLGNRFADMERLIYTSAMQNGPGHQDFGDPAKVFMEPEGSVQYTKPVILLTNRGCFSATSFFSTAMKAFPHVVQVGDTTGGGLGAPSGFELPNGWSYRFSVSETLTPDGENFEDGVPPDITVWMDPENEAAGIDDILERAISEILGK